MLDFHQKRKVRSVMYHRVTVVILSVITLIVLHSTWLVYNKKIESAEMKDVALRGVEELRIRDSDLLAKIDRLSTTPGVEEEVRSKFSVAKDGENAVVIVEDEETKVSTTSQKISFWTKLKNFFINN
ncbi:MAG: hypothetical protein WAX85_02275 [Minisyncoccia bacterium]